MNIPRFKPLLKLLFSIFLIGLLLQFFLQTFVTFQLGWTGTFRNVIRMWKEFLLLLFVIVILFTFLQRKHFQNMQRYTSRHAFKIFFKKHFLFQFILLFAVSAFFFFLIAIFIQNVGISSFILSFKYDLLPFFIFGVGVCLALLFFTEKDQTLFQTYKKLIRYCIRGGLARRLLVYFMPNALKFFGYNNFAYEGTVGARPPAAYYTLINKGFVRNQFLFERPISFGFWLIAFFPLFALGYLRNKSLKKQIFFTVAFGLLVLSTRSRAAIAVFCIEVIGIALFLHRKLLRKWLRIIITIGIIGILGYAYLGQRFFAREHSNTGHLVLMVEGRNLAKKNLITGRGAGYAGPASHQICYTPDSIDIFATEITHPDPRCEEIRKVNIAHQIATYGYNPENQYLQILMEYGIIGLLCRGAMLGWILRYTVRMIWIYRKKEKSPYQTRIYYSILGLGIGLLGLCAEGMVLHSLGDRMIVYPFFLLYGLAVGFWEKEKDVVYLPEQKGKGKRDKIKGKGGKKKEKDKHKEKRKKKKKG